MNYPILQVLKDNNLLKCLKRSEEISSQKIEKFHFEKKTPSWAKDTLLLRVEVWFEGNKKITLRASAKRRESMKETWEIMRFLYKKSLNLKSLRIPRPIIYCEKFNTLIYKEVKGESFVDLLNKGSFLELKESVKKIGKLLADLHSLKVKKDEIRKAKFLKSKGYEKLLLEIGKIFPTFKKLFLKKEDFEFLDKVWEASSFFIHNDFYPGNIIIGKEKVFAIDFDRSGLGPFEMDLASLIGYFDFPEEIRSLKLSKNRILELEKVLFETYAKERGIDKKETEKRVKKFLIKIYLDQLNYYFNFMLKGWNYMDKEAKKFYTLKLKALLEKTKKQTKNL